MYLDDITAATYIVDMAQVKWLAGQGLTGSIPHIQICVLYDSF